MNEMIKFSTRSCSHRRSPSRRSRRSHHLRSLHPNRSHRLRSRHPSRSQTSRRENSMAMVRKECYMGMSNNSYCKEQSILFVSKHVHSESFL